jgi:hypothetical protein
MSDICQKVNYCRLIILASANRLNGCIGSRLVLSDDILQREPNDVSTPLVIAGEVAGLS